MDLNAKRKTIKLEDKVGENRGDVGFGDDITKSMINERKKTDNLNFIKRQNEKTSHREEEILQNIWKRIVIQNKELLKQQLGNNPI